MKKTPPKAIYIDTNILLQLPQNFESAEFERLKNLCDVFRISIVIPETVLKELTNKRKITVLDGKQNIDTSISKMEPFTSIHPLINWSIQEKDILLDVEKTISNTIEKHNIKVVKTPDIDTNRLVDMAINQESPFRKEGRGFCDTVILFSILENAVQTRSSYHLFVSANKKDFDTEKVSKIADSFKIELQVVETLSDAVKILEQSFDELYTKFIDKQSNTAKLFLETQKQSISEFIKTKGLFSPAFFRASSKDIPYLSRIIKINDMTLNGVSQVTLGDFLTTKYDERVTVSFVANERFLLLIEKLPYPWLRTPAQIQKDEHNWIWKALETQEKTEEMPFNIDIKIEASVHAKGVDQFSDLRLERIDWTYQ